MPGVDIVVEGITTRYERGASALTVLDDVSIRIDAASHVAIIGHSGAGKSTLLAHIGGLEPIQEGTVTVGDRDVSSLHGDGLARYRRITVGFMFQQFGLLPILTAAENIELAMLFASADRRQRRDRAHALLAAVGMSERAGHRPTELSGGEAQRVALARALANEPEVILADEPTGNLDGTTAVQALDVLRSVASERSVTLLTVTHDPTVARRADRVIELRQGQVIAE